MKAIFSEAIEAPSEERAALVAVRCADDDECRQEVESLLAAYDRSESIPGARKAIASAASTIVGEQDSVYRDALDKALSPQYEILRLLGRGGMGAVYLAREKALERLVAIKVLRPDLVVSSDSRERFRREARIVAQLSHPGILQLHTFGELPDVWYFVTTFVRGESLAERLRRRGRLPWSEAFAIMLELADALDCAHRHSVIHRDIKPANVLLDEESGRSVLADFGISKMPGMSDGLTETGMVFGTPDYMSPEQTLGLSDIDERTDIYSLGAVSYVMLTGREPFAGASAAELMYARLSHDPPEILSIVPSVPEELAAMVMRCLARDRANRWPNARSLKTALLKVRGSGQDGLPEGIKDLPSFGPYTLMWVVAWTSFALLTERSPAERALLLLVALLVPLGLVLHVWNVGRSGIGFVHMLRVASWPPEWWGMWWPRSLRRPSDVWNRLPLPARLTRIALSSVVMLVPLTMLMRGWLSDAGWRFSDGVFLGVEAGLGLAAVAISAWGFLWAQSCGLRGVDAAKFLFGATADSASWSDAPAARMLLSSAGRTREPDRNDPADLCRAIKEALPGLAGNSAHVRGAAEELAERALREIRKIEDEAESLERNASNAEVDKLSSRLALLGPADRDQTAEQIELRVLLQQQLDVMRRMRASIQRVRGRRGLYVSVLQSLWSAVSETTEGGELSARIESLSAELTTAQSKAEKTTTSQRHRGTETGFDHGVEP